jgi:hypothetical protein
MTSQAAILQHAVDYIHQLEQQKSCLAQMLEIVGRRDSSQQQQQQMQVASDPLIGVRANQDLVNMVEKISSDSTNALPPYVAVSTIVDAAETKQLVPPPAKRRRTENSSSSTSSASSEDGSCESSTRTLVGQISAEDSTQGCRLLSSSSGSSATVATLDGCCLQLTATRQTEAGLNLSRLQAGNECGWISGGSDIIKKVSNLQEMWLVNVLVSCLV